MAWGVVVAVEAAAGAGAAGDELGGTWPALHNHVHVHFVDTMEL